MWMKYKDNYCMTSFIQSLQNINSQRKEEFQGLKKEEMMNCYLIVIESQFWKIQGVVWMDGGYRRN